MSTTVAGLVLAVIIAAAILTLHLLDRRLAAVASRQWEQARHVARVSGLADRRSQDELEGWR
jgi:peptidoglycan/LPS O-acetylase OafA/YrhL